MIKTKICEDSVMFNIEFTCPICGEWDKIYNMLPIVCLQCGSKFPNIFNIIYSDNVRIQWHRGNDYPTFTYRGK